MGQKSEPIAEAHRSKEKNKIRTRVSPGKDKINMIIFKISTAIDIENHYDHPLDSYSERTKIRSATSAYNSQKNNTLFFVSEICDGDLEITAITDAVKDFERKKENFITLLSETIGCQVSEVSCREETVKFLNSTMSDASHASFLCHEEREKIEEMFGIKQIENACRRDRIDFDEALIESASKEEIVDEVSKYMFSETLIPEIDRIYTARKRSRVYGNPVQYLVQTSDRDTRKAVYRALIKALYANNRIALKRYFFTDIFGDEDFQISSLKSIYKASRGGCVVIRYTPVGSEENENYVNGNAAVVDKISAVIKEFKNDVLTIFCVPRDAGTAIRDFYQGLSDVSVIEIVEETAGGEKAANYLKMRCKKSSVNPDKKLFAAVEPGKFYTPAELDDIFGNWLNNKLKTVYYPEYKGISTARAAVVKSSPKGSAYEELMSMTGLDEAKRVITDALNYFKAQKLFQEKGFKNDRPSMNMIFTGDPGTAKTTVARLFARIMADNGLLSGGQLIEVGRADLVAKYVGHTAKNVKEKFRRAKGGVLFCDEIYSLVDDRRGSFGDEAISTMVQEMENHRDDVVVILAGYRDKMEHFLETNPGLRSRIAFHVPFANYNVDELLDISKFIAEKKGLTLSDDAMEKLGEIYRRTCSAKDFGNGRFVRNCIEMAKMRLATRLLGMDIDSLTQKQCTTLTKDDIEAPRIGDAERSATIGFTA